MKDVKLKICGMREKDNILQIAALHPDYMGFIFYEKSPRYVGEEFEIPAGFSSEIEKVGVFVNASNEVMVVKAKRYGLDYLQLHGHESVEQVAALKQLGLKVIKVFSVDENFDFTATIPYQDHVSFFLFDTKGKYYGGNATVFDWRCLQRYNQQVPFFLSGGLSPENVTGISDLQGMNIHALDVNSGVELSPGLKDADKINSLKKVLESLTIQ